MSLLEENPGDVDFENTADLTINGRTFENQNVTGDKKEPKRRDVFPGSDARKRFGGDFPKKAKVEWQGTTYPARLSFRVRKGGGRVPVYEFFLDAETRRELRNR